MRNKKLIIIILVLSVVALKINNIDHKEKEEEKVIDEPETIVTILDKTSGEIKKLNLEDYIIGVVAAEMPASFQMEALKAQAVASRSFALYKINTSNGTYDLVTDVTDQSYITIDEMRNKWQNNYETYYTKVKEAVDSTKDQVLTYNNEVICAFYFAMSNGYTEDADLVFGESQDYLTSVDSSFDKNVKNFEVTVNIPKTEFCEKLNINCDKLQISNINYSKTGRINSLTINDQQFQGTQVRSLLGLRSTDFNIVISDEISITTKGYGHGVGMSQYGANELAKMGKSYEDILNYYYQNIVIKKMNV